MLMKTTQEQELTLTGKTFKISTFEGVRKTSILTLLIII